jgi:hypothetical protein
MATEAQILANRRNAQFSTGPRSLAGKAASRMNAFRHGLTQQIDVTMGDDKEARDKFFAAIISSLAPEGAIESQFAHSVADGHWRLNRASSIENNIFTLACSRQADLADDIRAAAETADPAETDDPDDPEVEKALDAARVFIADPKRFQLLTIYEGRIHRTMTKNLQQLHELQALRRAEESRQEALRLQGLDEARLLTQLAETEGMPCDIATEYPDPNGFVFSTGEIAQSIRRLTRLETARHTLRPDIRRAA